MAASTIKKTLSAILTATAMLHAGAALASISLSATRIVLLEKQQEASLIVRNEETPVLIQSWLESNSENDTGELPFAISPALAKMLPKGQQVMRILYAGGQNDLPRDRETVVWLNVQEVPQASDEENHLQIAVRQRIKLFFRPAGLPGSAEQAPTALQWSVVQKDGASMLQIHNPSAFHVSMSLLKGAGKELKSPGMVGPGQTRLLPFGLAGNTKLHFKAISDYGSAESYEVQLAGGAQVLAKTVISTAE
ncbi:MAG: molecular chaperone [Acidovorax sp.]|nr:molecular chaperone [Acidovorax sp.]